MEWIQIFATTGDLEKALVIDQPRLLIVRDKRICMVRRQSGLLAVEDKCPHNGESLSKGAINYKGEIVCPWHGQRFDLRTGREADENSRDLITYPVREGLEGVFIGI